MHHVVSWECSDDALLLTVLRAALRSRHETPVPLVFFRGHSKVLRSCHLRTLHPKLHVARTGRALPADATSAQFAPPLQHRPDNCDRRWGLIPGWWKKTAKKVPSTFNARAETVAQKPMFRSAFKRTRCIVPASGYYEWRAVEGGKQPYFISAADGGVLSIAGLWDQWKEPETGETISSATLVVTAANDFTRSIHERTPVLLGQHDLDAWLAGRPVLSSYSPRRMTFCECGRYRSASTCLAGETMTPA
jgi:putative SOS response-associated peptidase YedK